MGFNVLFLVIDGGVGGYFKLLEEACDKLEKICFNCFVSFYMLFRYKELNCDSISDGFAVGKRSPRGLQ